MKSFIMLIITFVILIAVVGTSGVLFYLTKTSEIERSNQSTLLSSPAPQQ